MKITLRKQTSCYIIFIHLLYQPFVGVKAEDGRENINEALKEATLMFIAFKLLHYHFAYIHVLKCFVHLCILLAVFIASFLRSYTFIFTR